MNDRVSIERVNSRPRVEDAGTVPMSSAIEDSGKQSRAAGKTRGRLFCLDIKE